MALKLNSGEFIYLKIAFTFVLCFLLFKESGSEPTGAISEAVIPQDQSFLITGDPPLLTVDQPLRAVDQTTTEYRPLITEAQPATEYQPHLNEYQPSSTDAQPNINNLENADNISKNKTPKEDDVHENEDTTDNTTKADGVNVESADMIFSKPSIEMAIEGGRVLFKCKINSSVSDLR